MSPPDNKSRTSAQLLLYVKSKSKQEEDIVRSAGKLAEAEDKEPLR